MKTVGADQEIESPFSTARESNVQAAFVFVDVGHRVIEECLGSRAGTLEDDSGEFPSGDAHEAIPQSSTDGRCTDLRTGRARRIDESKTIDEIPPFSDRGENTHAFSHVESEPPEVEHVPGGSQRRRVFDERRLEAVLREPVGEGRAGNA